MIRPRVRIDSNMPGHNFTLKMGSRLRLIFLGIIRRPY